MLNLRWTVTALLSAALALGGLAGKTMEPKWNELPPLPPSPGQSRQPGLAGPFAGAHGEVLFVGGGANFPGLAPWEGGTKAWWKDLFVLEHRRDGTMQWVGGRSYQLPRPIAYGTSFNTPDGVICAGGCDAAQCYRDVFLLAWNPVTREVNTTALPPLPEPLAFMAGAMVGQTIYVAGGQQAMKDAVPASAFWALDLARSHRPGEFKWEVLPAWPGSARILPVAAGSGGKVHLFGGRAFHAGRVTDILTDAYAFDPATRAWRTLAPITPGAEGRPWSVMGGTAVTTAEGEILVIGGDRGDLFRRLDALDLEVEGLKKRLKDLSAGEAVAVQKEIEARLQAKRKIYETHPGFGREVLAYDPPRDRWRVVGQSPGPGQVTTIAVPWGAAVVIPSGEIRPGIRTAALTRLTPTAP